jgi:S-DNA-T family DNA segregation ATPase FtsK/SpoIIIE
VNLSFIIGVRELDGEVQYLNLGQPFGGQQSHAPHTLIAGTTGSGKSILIQNLLIDIALTNPPSLAKIYCIDPKMGVDYGSLEGLPHLVGGIIVEQDRAIIVLEQLIVEMDERYRRFASMKVPNLHAFNERVTAKERLPAIFVVHDEFAEWMLTDEYKDSVSSTVKRLGVKARAAGIHLFFAAQRPDKDVLPPQLRDNLGNRLILRVEGEGTSEIALGQKGAERLLGKGHCAARLQNESDLIYVQVPWLSGSDAEELVTAIKAGHRS